MSFVALGDYGADESAFSARQFQKVLAAVPNLKSNILPEPLSLSSAIPGPSENRIAFTVSQTVNFSITIVLPDNFLPIRIHQVPFLVVDQEMDKLLLGGPLLKKRGFDLKSHLESVSQVVNEKRFEGPNTGEILLARATFTVMRYNSVDDDPIEFPEAADATISLDYPAEIDNAFSRIREDTIKNKISRQGEHCLAGFLQNFRSVFCIKLGPDPPANVTPLAIKPKADDKPFGSPQRRYAPPQRAFISSTIRRLEEVGAVVKNPAARWVSPVLAVPKAGSK